MRKVLSLNNPGRKHFYAAATIDNFIYFSDWWSKGLFRVDLKTKEAELLDVFKSNNAGKLHGLAFPFENKIWFVPRTFEDEIAIYDVKKGHLEYLKLPQAKHLGQYELFKDYYIIGENAWLIPYSYDTVLTINLKNKKMTRLEGGIANVKEDGWPKFVGSCICGKKIFLCPWGFNKAVVVDADTFEMDELGLSIPQRTFRNVCAINNKLYFIPFDIAKGLLEYDILTTKCAHIELEKNLSGEYRAIYYDERTEKLTLFPYTGNEILLLDVHTWESEKIAIHVNGQEMVSNPYWCEVREMGKQIWIIAEESGGSELIYEEEGRAESFAPLFPKDMITSEINMMLKQDKHSQSPKRNVGASIYERVSG